MKKLKFMLAAATALGFAAASQADLPYGSTDFESISLSDELFTLPTDDESEIVTAATDYSGDRPRLYANDPASTKYLKVSTGTDPLLRKFNTSSAGVSGDGLYIDTLVQFTVTPLSDDVTTNENDKLLIYLKDDGSATNLMVKAARYQAEDVGGGVEESLEVCDVPVSSAVQPGQWYRLTVKSAVVPANEADPDNTDELLVFNIWLDGVQLSVPSEFGLPLFNDNTYGGRTVFPSLLGTANKRLAAVGFAGEGAVDDLAMTDEDPLATAYDFTLTLGEGVSAVTYTIAGGSAITRSGTGTYTNKVYEGEAIVIEAGSPVYATGYMAGSTTASGFAAGDGYTVGAANCSLAFTALTEPTVTTAGGATYTVANGVYTFTAPNGSVISSLLVDGVAVAAAEGQSSYEWTAVGGSTVTVTAMAAAAANPWFDKPVAVVLAENLPGQTGNIVSAFHGQGEGEYLGLTYSTNPLQFDLFQVNGTAVPVTVTTSTDTTAGLRGVAISKALGIAMALSYTTDHKVLAFPLAGGAATEVVKSSTHAFDAGAFSPDGRFFFSNNIAGESSKNYYVKWSVSKDDDTGVITLTKVDSIAASNRGRSLAYARINGRDLVFGLVDTTKVDVIDMTGDDTSAWTADSMITDLPTHSYGTLCVSGVNAYGATPHLTVATANNNGATKGDVLNVYALTVPASGAVTASLVKSFDEDALTAAGFGDISDANRYGNTVYVTDDEKTIYFARPDNKLYAAQFGVAYVGNTIYETLPAAVEGATAGDTVTVVHDCTLTSSLSIAKNLTVHNDATITGAVNYAICIGATVSFEGSGKIERASNITGSAFCVGANEVTRGAIAAGTAGTLNFTGLTVCGGSGGNLIKLENGTVNMNGGVLKDGLRGIKADADAGSYTSAIVINGGTITNCSACAVMASAESANGTATVTINGGVIAGALDAKTGASGQNGIHTITIPSNSTAQFNADQSTFCESGYETVLSDGWYVVQAVQSAGWVDDSSTIPANTSAATQYPTLAGTALADADAKKLTDWAKGNSVAFTDATTSAGDYVEAFLLNCAPTAAAVAEEKEEFVLDISVVNGTITISLPDGKTYNGTLQMKGSTDLTNWTNVNEASSSYQFYKYELSL